MTDPRATIAESEERVEGGRAHTHDEVAELCRIATEALDAANDLVDAMDRIIGGLDVLSEQGRVVPGSYDYAVRALAQFRNVGT